MSTCCHSPFVRSACDPGSTRSANPANGVVCPYSRGITSEPLPPGVLQVVVEKQDLVPSARALCAGFEGGRWRRTELARSLFDWLPDFALNHAERMSFNTATGVRQLRAAAQRVYSTDNFGRRGEFGELLLHSVLREQFDTDPAVSKIFYKDHPNDTVKGFDAVHVVDTPDGLELWLGEVKFYADLSSAIREVAIELNAHFERDYLRSELALVANKLEDDWSHSTDLAELLDPNTSLDVILDLVRVPVLLTYDSHAVASASGWEEAYFQEVKAELDRGWDLLTKKDLPADVVIHLLLVPIEDKAELVQTLHEELSLWQLL